MLLDDITADYLPLLFRLRYTSPAPTLRLCRYAAVIEACCRRRCRDAACYYFLLLC